jgi:hypothetical protein
LKEKIPQIKKFPKEKPTLLVYRHQEHHACQRSAHRRKPLERVKISFAGISPAEAGSTALDSNLGISTADAPV